MSLETNTIRMAKRILSKYNLCDRCLGRQFPHIGFNNREYGSSVRRATNMDKRDDISCHLCSGLMRSLISIGRKAMKTLERYEYSTFMIGTSLSPRLTEKEDEFRAEFKLRGGETIKSEVTKEISRTIARETGKRIRFKHQDVFLLIDPLLGSMKVTPSSIFIEGRYKKDIRGVNQKRIRCRSCRTLGCQECDYTGYSSEPSVEGQINHYLLSKFMGSKTVISWVGGEDSQSLVLGDGRPFFAEIQEPKIRHRITRSKKMKDGVSLLGIRLLGKRPPASPKFQLMVRAVIDVGDQFSKRQMKKLESFFSKREITAYSPNKRKYFTKIIHSITLRKVRKRSFTVDIYCDGGLNIKRFISGEKDEINPSISLALGVDCHARKEDPFDVLSVKIEDRDH